MNAAQIAVHCEAVKVSYRQTKDGMVVSFAIHPNEMPPELALAPVGTRVMLAVAEIVPDGAGDAVPADATPPREARVEQEEASGTNDTKSPARSAASKLSHAMKDKPSQAASAAGMMRSDARYRMYLKSLGWVADTEEQVAHAQRAEIEVKSCSEISLGGAAYERFQAHELAYKQWAGLAAEMR